MQIGNASVSLRPGLKLSSLSLATFLFLAACGTERSEEIVVAQAAPDGSEVVGVNESAAPEVATCRNGTFEQRINDARESVRATDAVGNDYVDFTPMEKPPEELAICSAQEMADLLASVSAGPIAGHPLVDIEGNALVHVAQSSLGYVFSEGLQKGSDDIGGGAPTDDEAAPALDRPGAERIVWVTAIEGDWILQRVPSSASQRNFRFLYIVADAANGLVVSRQMTDELTEGFLALSPVKVIATIGPDAPLGVVSG